MRKKKQHHEEHPDETWLLPYSDMLTLLLALFIVMFALGKVDQQKFQAISEAFNGIMGGRHILQQEGSNQVPSETSDSSELSNTQKEENTMNQIKSMLESEISKEGYTDKVKVGLSGEGLDITIQDVVLFNSGEAEILPNVNQLLVKISGMVKGLDNRIRFVGHTDNVPISTAKYRSNMDLSAMRAINVREFMVKSGGLNPVNARAEAAGEYEPKATNGTEEGRAQNRRVEIFIVRNYPTSN